MALPDFSKFKAPYRFVPEGRAFRLYEKGVKTNTTFKNMVEAKKKVLALNNAWRASPAGRKASPNKKYDATGHVIPKPAPKRRARTNPRRVGMFSTIEPGDRVTIVTPRGQEMTGRAMMRGPAGWVLNLGGRYGTPALADEDNVVKVSKSRRNPRSFVPSGAPEEVVQVAETLLENAKEAGFSETSRPVYVSQHGPNEWHVGSNFDDSPLWLYYIDGKWYYWNEYAEPMLKPMRGGFKEALSNAQIWWTG